jgi:hypothetical protein
MNPSPQLVRYVGYDMRAERAAARHMQIEQRTRSGGGVAIRRPTEPTPGSTLYYDRQLPRPRLASSRDLTEADYIDAAAQDWAAADNTELPQGVRNAYMRRALRFDAVARRLSWRRIDV